MIINHSLPETPSLGQLVTNIGTPASHNFNHPLNQHAGCQRLKKKEEVEMAVREWLRRQDRDLQRDGVFEYVPRWQKFVSVLSGHVGKQKFVSVLSGHVGKQKFVSVLSGHVGKQKYPSARLSYVHRGTQFKLLRGKETSLAPLVVQLVETLCYKPGIAGSIPDSVTGIFY